MQDLKSLLLSRKDSVKQRFPSLSFNSKNFYATFLNESHLIEELLLKLKKEKLKAKHSQEIDTGDFSQILKRQKEEKKLKDEIFEIEEDEIQIKVMKEVFEKKAKEKEEEMLALERKKQYLEKLSQKAKMRHEDLFKQKKYLLDISPLKHRPKYLEMQKEFKNNFEIPELERRKAELAKKRNLFQPISRQEWVEHMKKYNDYITQAERRRLAKLEESHDDSLSLINKEKREKAMETEEQRAFKKAMLEKRKKYAENVREYHAPKIEPKPESLEKPDKTDSISKSESVQKTIPEHLHKSVPERRVSHRIESESINPAKIMKKITEKKIKIIPDSKTPEVKHEKQADYLAERRKQRSMIEDKNLSAVLPNISELDLHNNVTKAIETFKKLDKFLSHQEYKIKSVDPKSALSFQLEENLNDMLTQSVKAKLRLL